MSLDNSNIKWYPNMIQSNAWCPGTGRNHVAASGVDPAKGAADKSARQQTLERKHLRDPWDAGDAGVLCDRSATFEALASWNYSTLRNVSNHNLCWILLKFHFRSQVYCP